MAYAFLLGLGALVKPSWMIGAWIRSYFSQKTITPGGDTHIWSLEKFDDDGDTAHAKRMLQWAHQHFGLVEM